MYSHITYLLFFNILKIYWGIIGFLFNIHIYVCVCARACVRAHLKNIFSENGSMTLKSLRIPILKQRHTSSFRLNALTSFGNDARCRSARWKSHVEFVSE